MATCIRPKRQSPEVGRSVLYNFTEFGTKLIVDCGHWNKTVRIMYPIWIFFKRDHESEVIYYFLAMGGKIICCNSPGIRKYSSGGFGGGVWAAGRCKIMSNQQNFCSPSDHHIMVKVPNTFPKIINTYIDLEQYKPLSHFLSTSLGTSTWFICVTFASLWLLI